jgi:SAM-dependent methyltransferase
VDEVARYNVERWRALVEADALYTRPLLDLDEASAREHVDPAGTFGDLRGRRVLCLAGGGGRQSVAFALLGARVTVFDLSEEQLAQDRHAAAHYGFEVETLQGDMRDLSPLAAASFDLVYHSYSLNFVPDARAVFREVARVLAHGGLYHFMFANPFTFGAGPRDWNGEGYTLRHAYADGEALTMPDEDWVYERGTGARRIPGSREYPHALSTVVGGLVEQGFVILRLWDESGATRDESDGPGTWAHFADSVRPWLTFLAALRTDVFENPAPAR